MSRVITVFITDCISEKSIFDFVEYFGGYVMSSDKPSHSQGVVEKGDATIWIYYSNNIKFFDRELNNVKQNFNFDIKTIIQLELNSEDESRLIALNFCKSLLDRYPNSVVLDDSFSRYYSNEELQKTRYNEDGLWSFL